MHLIWLFFVLFCSQASATPVAVPELRQQVTDLSDTLNPAQIRALTGQTQQLAPAQVAILVVPTTGEETIEQYATRVFDKWELGDKARSDGVLLLVAWQDHTVRIEVGYGLEGTLTDAQSGKIIRTAIIPAFRENNLALGLQRGIAQIGTLLAGDSIVSPPSSSPSVMKSPAQINTLFQITLLAFYILTAWVFRTKNRLIKAIKCGLFIIIGCEIWAAFYPSVSVSHGFIACVGLAGAVLRYVFLTPVSKDSSGRGRRLSGRSSNRGARRHGSRSRGGGGYNGGGGSSGGGGASGRW